MSCAKRIFGTFTAISAALCFATCDDPYDTGTYDQTWQVRYFVSNPSSVDLFLSWGTEFFYASPMVVEVPAGTKREIAHYDEFLGPPPDAGRTFTCISAYRASDSLLVFQLSPVRNSQWTRHEPVKYRPDFTLSLTDAKLDMDGIDSQCGQLIGTAVDSVTTGLLDYVYVVVREDSVSCCLIQTNSILQTSYTLMWSDDIPSGSIRVSRFGYRSKTLRLPDDVRSLGDRRYRLDVVLAPLPPP